MKFSDLKREAERLTPKQVPENLRVLAQDPRFPALVAWLEGNRREWARCVTSQAIAKDHGKLAHAAGSLYALEVLVGQLQTTVDKPAKEDA